MIRKSVLAAIALIGATAAWAQPGFPAPDAPGGTGGTQTFTPQPMALPPFGLGSTETARIDLMNVAAASSTGTTASCTGSVAFYNASGTQIGSSTSFTLGTNQISPVNLTFAAAGLSSPRGEITAVVTPTVPSSSTAAPPCALRVTLATFDSTTGATHLFIGGPGGPGVGHP